MGQSHYGGTSFDGAEQLVPGLPSTTLQKLALAAFRIGEFKDEELSFIEGQRLEVARKVVGQDQYGRSTTHQVVWVRREETPNVIGLLLGEIVHAIRCALDHMAFSLVTSEAIHRGATLTDAQKRNIQFPIYDEEEHFEQNVDRLLPFVQDRHREWIRCRQPYNAMPGMEHQHPLSIVSRLDNLDKHRSLPVVAHALVIFRDNWGTSVPKFRWVPATEDDERERGVIGQYDFDQPCGTVDAPMSFEYGLNIMGVPRQHGEAWKILENCLDVVHHMVITPLA